jgi:hypothetical protein
MSYLHPPRLHFSGYFQADPSTVNNDPEHYDTSRFQSNYTLPQTGQSENGWWNPGGTANWRFYQCAVRQVVYADGTTCDDGSVDPIVGSPVATGDGRADGKLVDLDPEQQMVSEIWGLRVMLGGSGGFLIDGDFEVAAFGDLWSRYPQGKPASFFGTFYQSVLQNLRWKNQSQSRFLQELERLSPKNLGDRKLSIKFNVDGYNDDSSATMFTFGRVVGSIGLYLPGEPIHFVAARALTATPGVTPAMGTAYALIDGDSLFLDLGNTIPTQSAGGPIVTNIGQIYAAALPTNAPPVLLGEIHYQNSDWYAKTTGIVQLKADAGAVASGANGAACRCPVVDFAAARGAGFAAAARGGEQRRVPAGRQVRVPSQPRRVGNGEALCDHIRRPVRRPTDQSGL